MSAAKHLAKIHTLPCVVCLYSYGVRRPCEEAHHIESVRDWYSDYATVPLCKDCHDGLHQSRRRAFYRSHKLSDVKLLALTLKELYASNSFS